MSDPALIVACYRGDATAATVRFVEALAQALPLGRRIWVANSAEAAEALARAGIVDAVMGSNLAAEWSAWDEGLARLRQQGEAPPGVVFLNDTVVAHRTFTRFRLAAFVRAVRAGEWRRRPEIIGFTDGGRGLPDDFTIRGTRLHRWVSSYMFLVSGALLEALGGTVVVEPALVQEWQDAAGVDAFFPVWVGSGMAAHLERWLFGGGWYRSQPLTPESLPLFRAKAAAIYHEMLLTAAAVRLSTVTDAMRRCPDLRLCEKAARLGRLQHAFAVVPR